MVIYDETVRSYLAAYMNLRARLLIGNRFNVEMTMSVSHSYSLSATSCPKAYKSCGVSGISHCHECQSV